MSLLKKKDNTKTLKYVLNTAITFGIMGLIFLVVFLAKEVPIATSIDFSSIRKSISAQDFFGKAEGTEPIKSKQGKTAVVDEKEQKKKLNKIREAYVKEGRARIYVDDAIMDYHKQNYEGARYKLERAKTYDPSNYKAFRISAQIYLENQQFTKAYNEMERAANIPNEDISLPRDLDTLRKLIRYNRSEIDRLQHYIHRHPEDSVADARLQEIKEQLKP